MYGYKIKKGSVHQVQPRLLDGSRQSSRIQQIAFLKSKLTRDNAVFGNPIANHINALNSIFRQGIIHLTGCSNKLRAE
jgi:hypothetical protein